MTNEQQPEALRLANILQTNTMHSQAVDLEAAAKLRCLYAENADFRATCDHLTCENAEQIGEIVALKEQRDELLEALRRIAATSAKQSGTGAPWVHWVDQARAAIAKATGETK